MRTKNKPKKRVAPKPVEAKVSKPQIPDKILKDFLEEQCNFSKLKNISKIRAGFLWEKGKIQRYRINVWQTTYQMVGSAQTLRLYIHILFSTIPMNR